MPGLIRDDKEYACWAFASVLLRGSTQIDFKDANLAGTKVD